MAISPRPRKQQRSSKGSKLPEGTGTPDTSKSHIGPGMKREKATKMPTGVGEPDDKYPGYPRH